MKPDANAVEGDLRRWYVLVLATLVYALNIADRFVSATLIEPIKADLHLSDSAIGFLTGVSLALFYVFMGLPLAELADRTNRRNLITLSLAGWSAMTALSGLTRNFWQLLLTRIGVGVGEAGGTPASSALVSDYFPWRQRAFALSVFALGASIGSMFGSSAGYVSDAWGWRSAYLVLGIPGVLLGLLLFATVREPERGRLDPNRSQAKASLLDSARHAWRVPSLRHCIMGATIFTLWAWGLMWWTPSFLVRSHGMSLGDAGGALALMQGIGGSIILVAVTVLMKLLQKRDARIVPGVVALVILLGTVPSIIAFTTHSRSLTLGMLWIFIPLSYGAMGPTFGLIQNLAPPNMRSQAVAIMLLTANIANLVIAPQVIGIVSDHLAPAYGHESLRIALIPLAFTGFWAALHYTLCARHLARDLRTAGIEAIGGESLAGAAPGGQAAAER